jgi:hypothetical protein
MKTKNFDCVQMKRLGAAKVREQTAALTSAVAVKAIGVV